MQFHPFLSMVKKPVGQFSRLKLPFPVADVVMLTPFPNFGPLITYRKYGKTCLGIIMDQSMVMKPNLASASCEGSLIFSFTFT